MAAIVDEDNMQAVPLITCNLETGVYSVGHEAAAWLRSLEAPIGVIACAGKYRTGKSFLHNCLCRAPPGCGFDVGETVQACTKGLWMYRHLAKGKRCSLIYIDTEGIDALDADNTHDVRIFTLALLLSTTFLYNSTGALDEAAMQRLSLVTNVISSIRYDENETGDEDACKTLASHMPAFYWILRDFSLRLEDSSGASLTPQQYLESALHQSSTSDREAVRSTIRTAFPDRTLIALPRPATNDGMIQKLEFRRHCLSDAFNKAVDSLRLQLEEHTKPLCIETRDGMKHQMSGDMFVHMCEHFASIVSSAKVPIIRDAWSLMEEVRHRDVKDEILKNCAKGTDDEMLRHLLNAMDTFDKRCPHASPTMRALFSEEVENLYMARLQEHTLHADDAPTLFRILESFLSSKAASVERVLQLVQRELLPRALSLVEGGNARVRELEQQLVRQADEYHVREQSFIQRTEHAERMLQKRLELPTHEEEDADEQPAKNQNQDEDASTSDEAKQVVEHLKERLNQSQASERQLRDAQLALDGQLADLRAECCTLRELHIAADDAHRDALQQLQRHHTAQVVVESQKRQTIEADLDMAREQVRKLEEECRCARKEAQACAMDARRAHEQYISMQAALQDGQVRLMETHKESMDMAMQRDERQYSALERVTQECASARKEALILENTLTCERKRHREVDECLAIHRKQKIDADAVRDELAHCRAEVEFLLRRRDEITLEREEFRKLFMERDRRVAVLEAMLPV